MSGFFGGGMPADMKQFLNLKYGIAQQNANAETARANIAAQEVRNRMAMFNEMQKKAPEPTPAGGGGGGRAAAAAVGGMPTNAVGLYKAPEVGMTAQSPTSTLSPWAPMTAQNRGSVFGPQLGGSSTLPTFSLDNAFMSGFNGRWGMR